MTIFLLNPYINGERNFSSSKESGCRFGLFLESVQALMDRFILRHKLIRYNPETRELAIKNWGKYNLHKAGKPVMDCIISELKEAEDSSLIQYVAESILKDDIRCLYESCCNQEEMFLCNEESDARGKGFPGPGIGRCGQYVLYENENEKKQQNHQQDVQAIIEFWNAKEQLLSWLDDSNFLRHDVGYSGIGQCQQDTDVIMFMYRDRYYNKESQDYSLEIIVSKIRNGSVGTF